MDSIISLTAHLVAPQHKFLISVAACIGSSLFTPEEVVQKFFQIQEAAVETGLVPVVPSTSSITEFSLPTRTSTTPNACLPSTVLPSATACPQIYTAEVVSTYTYQTYPTTQPTASSNLILIPLVLIGIYSLYLLISSRKRTDSKLITSKFTETKIEEPVELLEELSCQNFIPNQISLSKFLRYDFACKRNEQLFEYLKPVFNPGDIVEEDYTDSNRLTITPSTYEVTDSYCGEWDYAQMGADNTTNPEWNWLQYHTINIGYADLLIQTRCIQTSTFQVQEIHFIHITFKPIYDNDAIDIEPSYLPLIIEILCMFYIQNKFMKLRGGDKVESKVYKEIEYYPTNDECRIVEIESDEEFIDELDITDCELDGSTKLNTIEYQANEIKVEIETDEEFDELDITELDITEYEVNEAKIEANYDEEVTDGLDMRGDEINYVNDVNDDDEEVNGELDVITGGAGDTTGLNITESVGVNDKGLIRGELGDSVGLDESEVEDNAEEVNGELGIIGGYGLTQLHATECELNESQIDVDVNEEVIGNVYSTHNELGLNMVEEEEKEEEEEEEAIEVRSDEQVDGNVYSTDKQLDDLELGIKDSYSIQTSEPKQSNKRRRSKFCKVCRYNTHFTKECKVTPPPPPSSGGQSEESSSTTTPSVSSNQVLESEEVTTHFIKDYNDNHNKRYYNNSYRYNYAYNNRYNQKYNNSDNYKYKYKYKYNNRNYNYNRRSNNDDMDKPWR